METINAIFSRRSVRSFNSKPLLDETLLALVKAGMQAPSARNYQPWHFVLIKNRNVLDKISEVHPYAEMARQAQAGILVCADLTIEPEPGYNALNCAAATQNILLAAHDGGIGAVWLGVYPRTERIYDMRRLFKLPEQILPISLIMLGYPAQKPQPADRFKEERLHYEVW